MVHWKSSKIWNQLDSTFSLEPRVIFSPHYDFFLCLIKSIRSTELSRCWVECSSISLFVFAFMLYRLQVRFPGSPTWLCSVFPGSRCIKALDLGGEVDLMVTSWSQWRWAPESPVIAFLGGAQLAGKWMMGGWSWLVVPNVLPNHFLWPVRNCGKMLAIVRNQLFLDFKIKVLSRTIYFSGFLVCGRSFQDPCVPLWDLILYIIIHHSSILGLEWGFPLKTHVSGNARYIQVKCLKHKLTFEGDNPVIDLCFQIALRNSFFQKQSNQKVKRSQKPLKYLFLRSPKQLVPVECATLQ